MSDLAVSKSTIQVVRGQISKNYKKLNPFFVDSLTKEKSVAELKKIQIWLLEIQEADAVVLNDALSQSTVDTDAICAMKDKNEEYIEIISIMINRLEERIANLTVPLLVPGQAATLSGGLAAPARSNFKLPDIPLPEFHADDDKDKISCRVFFDQFEAQLKTHVLEQSVWFSLLKSRLRGKALKLVVALATVKQCYQEAKTLLLDAFDSIVPMQFRAIERFLKLKMANNDPVSYWADLRQSIVNMQELNCDLAMMYQYVAWHGMNRPMQDCLVQVTSETYPSYALIDSQFMIASQRYVASKVHNKPTKVETSSQAIALPLKKNKSNSNKGKKGKTAEHFTCRLCKTDEHANWSCTKFATAREKITELTKRKWCTQCQNPDHKVSDCKFKFNKTCSNCGGRHFSWLCINKTSQNKQQIHSGTQDTLTEE